MPTVTELMTRPYRVALERSDAIDGTGGWVASIAELPGCLAQGDTPAAALDAMDETKPIWFESMLAHGKPIPPLG